MKYLEYGTLSVAKRSKMEQSRLIILILKTSAITMMMLLTFYLLRISYNEYRNDPKIYNIEIKQVPEATYTYNTER